MSRQKLVRKYKISGSTAFALTLVLGVLEWYGKINIGWLWVTAPLWLPLAIWWTMWILFFLFIIVVAAIATYLERK